MHSILAIAKVTLKDALRKKVLFTILFFAVLLIVASGFLPSVRAEDRVRQMVKISMAGIGFFGMIVAIFLSATSLPDDISRKTIFTVLTKPARRWEILAGKILGLGYVLGIILAVMGLAAFICVRAWAGRLEGARTSAAGQSDEAAAGMPLLASNKATYAKSVEYHGLQLELTPSMIASERAIASGLDTITYHFGGLDAGAYSGDKVFAQVVLFSHGSSYDNVTREGTASFKAANPSTGDTSETVFGAETLRPVPVSFDKRMIDAKGGLDITIRRRLEIGSYSAMASSVAVLSQPSGFGVNFAKALALVFVQCMVLVFIAVSASTVLTSTVSTIFALFVYFTGSLTNVLRDQALALGTETDVFRMGEHTHGSQEIALTGYQWLVNVALRWFYLGISALFPDLSSYDLSGAVSQNEYISLQSILAGLTYGAVYAAAAFLIAWLIFRRKEVA